MKVTIADLNVGNLHSLRKALERLGAEVEISADVARWLAADVLVLPGDGAFGATMAAIGPHREALKRRVLNRPTLGVCVGMQILFERSAEGEGVEGLGLCPGLVEKLPARRLPHMGWNTLEHDGGELFAGIPQRSHFYFVHSYAVRSCDQANAWCDYEGRFVAAVQVGSCSYAVQFHPEKSDRWGLELLDNFLSLAEEWLLDA